MSDFDKARTLLKNFKGDKYLYGNGVLSQVGDLVASIGQRPVLVYDSFPGSDKYVNIIRKSISNSGRNLVGELLGARPNAPREDLFRIKSGLEVLSPDTIISFGGGSTIDAVKAAEVLRRLGGEIDNYFGTGMVTQSLAKMNVKFSPHIAIQTAASSGAHLTKYSNITDAETGQKKLIVDEAIVPEFPTFDYKVTHGAPSSLTADGALDGIAHSLEVLYSAVGKANYNRVLEVATTGIRLIVNHLPQVMQHTGDMIARTALCLGTDLGGYAIMLGGTNGGHLTSFSLVDILSHGRACAMMNPYYTVFFAPAIEYPLRKVGDILKDAGLLKADITRLRGRDLGLAVAEAMLEFSRTVGFPTQLSEVDGFTDKYIDRALTAAKNPQLEMKLKNMPIPLTTQMVDDYMRPVLEAARDGNLSHIRNVVR